MKKFKGILILITFILLVSFISITIILKIYYIKDIDTVEINKITNESSNSWGNLNKLDTLSFTYDFIIIDTNKNILYSKGSHTFNSIESTIKKHDTYMDIIKDNKQIGTAIIFADLENDILNFKAKISKIILFTYAIVGILLILYFYYLYKNILHPFKKLKNFAYQIANGNLDTPLLMDKNNIFGEFTESFDIMREELNKAKEKEYLVNKSKKELVASLSHDIKTPVTSIKLISELLLVMIQEEKIKNKIFSIYNKADQIDHLVTDMFNATLEELSELKVTVSDEYSTSLKELFHNADYYNKIILSEIPPCAIQVDILRLQQVINNVINNSYKYANTTINVDFNLDYSYIQINIKDYGQGVSEDELPLLFNKFYRGNNTNIQKQNGAGLGLYISKYLMNEMGGDINCYNENDGFKVELLIQL